MKDIIKTWLEDNDVRHQGQRILVAEGDGMLTIPELLEKFLMDLTKVEVSHGS